MKAGDLIQSRYRLGAPWALGTERTAWSARVEPTGERVVVVVPGAALLLRTDGRAAWERYTPETHPALLPILERSEVALDGTRVPVRIYPYFAAITAAAPDPAWAAGPLAGAAAALKDAALEPGDLVEDATGAPVLVPTGLPARRVLNASEPRSIEMQLEGLLQRPPARQPATPAPTHRRAPSGRYRLLIPLDGYETQRRAGILRRSGVAPEAWSRLPDRPSRWLALATDDVSLLEERKAAFVRSGFTTEVLDLKAGRPRSDAVLVVLMLGLLPLFLFSPPLALVLLLGLVAVGLVTQLKARARLGTATLAAHAWSVAAEQPADALTELHRHLSDTELPLAVRQDLAATVEEAERQLAAEEGRALTARAAGPDPASRPRETALAELATTLASTTGPAEVLAEPLSRARRALESTGAR